MDENELETAVYLSIEEAVSLADLLSNHLIEIIRSDIDIDNIDYVANLVHVWKVCSAFANVYKQKKLMKFLSEAACNDASDAQE